MELRASTLQKPYDSLAQPNADALGLLLEIIGNWFTAEKLVGYR
jgi:hypothetical protein